MSTSDQTPPEDPASPNPDGARVSELLGSLPPSEQTMPPELAARIEASLAQEHARRAPGAPVVPLATRRRRSVGPWILGAAAAAALVVAVPTVIDQGSNEMAGSDSAPASDEAGAPAASEPPPPRSQEQSDGDASGTMTSSRPTDGGRTTRGGTPFVLTVSDRRYTEETLRQDARIVTSSSARESYATGFQDTESPSIGPIGTERGARDCLEELGADHPAPFQVDVGTFDGRPGFLLVAQDGPEDERVTRAWAVAAGCEPIYDEPVDLP